ncbi:MAG: hypothetical protein GY906_28535, partial [bacterium]|nr:hypothetical protein [bacterium]
MNNESPSTSQTRTRIVLLVLLTALALGTVGADIVGVFRGEPTSLDLGMVTDVRGHQLEVVRLIAADRNRRVTSAYRAGLRMGDRILAARVNDDQWLDLDRMTSWWKVLRHLNSSGEVEFKIDPVATEESDEVLIQLVITPEDPLSPMRWIVLGLCVVALMTAVFIGFGRPDSAQALTASLLFFSCSSMFSQQNALLVPGLWEVSLAYHALLNACATYLFMSFFLGFPSPSVLAIRFPWLRIAGRVAVGLHLMFAGAVLVTVSSSFRAYESLVVGLPSAVPFVISAMHVVMMLIGFASLILNTIRAQGVDERRRMVILLTGSVVGLVPLLAVGVLAYSIGLAEVPLWAIGVAISASVCFPVSFIYVVVRHRVLGIRVILRRGLQYALVSRGFLVVEALVLVALFIVTARSAFGRVIPEEGTIGLMIAAAVGLALFLGLRSVNRRIMPIIDRRFFREAYDTERVLAGLSTQVRCCAGRPREL